MIKQKRILKDGIKRPRCTLKKTTHASMYNNITRDNVTLDSDSSSRHRILNTTNITIPFILRIDSHGDSLAMYYLIISVL